MLLKDAPDYLMMSLYAADADADAGYDTFAMPPRHDSAPLLLLPPPCRCLMLPYQMRQRQRPRRYAFTMLPAMRLIFSFDFLDFCHAYLCRHAFCCRSTRAFRQAMPRRFSI